MRAFGGPVKAHHGVHDRRGVPLVRRLSEHLNPFATAGALHEYAPAHAVVQKRLSGRATMASSQSFSMSQRRMLLSPWPASPVKSEEPLWTSAMRLPSADLAFILDAMLARKSIWPSLERVTSDSSSPSCITLKRGSRIPSLPPIASRSFFQLFP